MWVKGQFYQSNTKVLNLLTGFNTIGNIAQCHSVNVTGISTTHKLNVKI